VLRLAQDGSYKQVFEGPITAAKPWLRYVQPKFDFTPLNDPGLYVIEYADQRTTPRIPLGAHRDIPRPSLA
jgi:hypothetical protein